MSQDIQKEGRTILDEWRLKYRENTTLDLIQKAEKRWKYHENKIDES